SYYPSHIHLKTLMDVEDKAHDIRGSIGGMTSWLDIMENKKKEKLSESFHLIP
ncbi:hypothetical protein A2U01_0091414, partial [Trifolium medium]|nr:hypothetical protein [Trifolium medium]